MNKTLEQIMELRGRVMSQVRSAVMEFEQETGVQVGSIYIRRNYNGMDRTAGLPPGSMPTAEPAPVESIGISLLWPGEGD